MRLRKISVRNAVTGEFEPILAFKGSDGKTPVRGVDYYTDGDKQAIIDNVIDSIPSIDINGAMSAHDSNTSAHSDIRDLIVQYLASSKTYTNEQIAQLIGSAPDMLDTLEEIATAITNNKSVSDTLNSAVVLKLGKEDAKSLYVALQGYVAYSQTEKSKLAGINMASKQNKTDNALATTSKDIVGAINEIKAGIGVSDVPELRFPALEGEFANEAILTSGVFTSFEQFDSIIKHLIDGGDIKAVKITPTPAVELKLRSPSIMSAQTEQSESGLEEYKTEVASASFLYTTGSTNVTMFLFSLMHASAKVIETGEVVHQRSLSFYEV